MKIAVTGASGFIGRHVLSDLRKHDVKVFVASRNPLQLIDLSESIKTITLDISNPPPNSFEQLGSPDVLIHLAWEGLPNFKSPHHLDTELPKQYHFLKTMIEAGLPSLIVTGTCFEYGMQTGVLSEDMQTKPSNPYGQANNILRQQLELLKSNNPFKFTWARLFYMYGQGQASTSLYQSIREAVLRGDKVFNMSGGEQLRDYLPVTEVARQIVLMAMAQRDIGIVNICSGIPISVRGLVEKWLRENNWKIELNLGYFPYPDYEPMAFWGSVDKLTSLQMNSFDKKFCASPVTTKNIDLTDKKLLP
jgi:nucleoside-diphosphate-sugar epimerase